MKGARRVQRCSGCFCGVVVVEEQVVDAVANDVRFVTLDVTRDSCLGLWGLRHTQRDVPSIAQLYGYRQELL